jgi:hypothetical protein
MGEPHSGRIRVRALATASFGVNDEVLDLEEAVQAEIPVSDLLCVEAVSCGPVRRPAYSAASSTSGGMISSTAKSTYASIYPYR